MLPVRGIWVDSFPRTVATSGFWDQLYALGFRSAAIMLDSWKRGLDPLYSESRLRGAISLAQERGIEVVLTAWPDCSEALIGRLELYLRRVFRPGVVGIEVDIEGSWYVRDAAGRRHRHPRYKQAGEYLGKRLKTLENDLGIRTEITTHTGHFEITKNAVVSPYCDRLVVQAYSVEHDQKQRYGWTHRDRGPGIAQARAARLAARVPGPALSMGLAAWAQSWPGHTVAEAMDTAYQAALAARPAEIRWWSSRNVLDGDSRDVREFFEGLDTPGLDGFSPPIS